MTGSGTGSLEIIAHRCRGYGAQEQSPRAIRDALADGASVHLAARLTGDGKWVVITGPDDHGSVRRVHLNAAARSRGIAIPIEHALAAIAAHGNRTATLYLEVKDTGGERSLLSSIDRLGLGARTILVSWEPQTLRRLHTIAPAARLGIAFVPLERSLRSARAITHREHPRARIRLAYDPALRFDALPGVGGTPVRALADDALVGIPLAAVLVPAILSRHVTIGRVHARGARLIAWGAHNRLVLRVLRARGVDGVLSDHASTLLTRA